MSVLAYARKLKNLNFFGASDVTHVNSHCLYTLAKVLRVFYQKTDSLKFLILAFMKQHRLCSIQFESPYQHARNGYSLTGIQASCIWDLIHIESKFCIGRLCNKVCGVSTRVKALHAAPIVMMWWGILWHSLQSPPSSPRSPQVVIASTINLRAYVHFQFFKIKFNIAWSDGNIEFGNSYKKSLWTRFNKSVSKYHFTINVHCSSYKTIFATCNPSFIIQLLIIGMLTHLA